MTQLSKIRSRILRRSFQIKSALFLLLVTAVLSSQPDNYGFVEGHHGWVSSHVLAIIKNADASRGFVGHTLNIQKDDGQRDYIYFDRYPVLFAAIMNLLIDHPWLSLRQQVRVARQCMNVIFCATMLIAYLLLEKLTMNAVISASAVLLTFSSGMLLRYKDMVHFDQPALFGCVMLLYVITLRSLERRPKWLLFLASASAIAMGRGYASYAILGVWVLVETLKLIKRHGFFINRTLRDGLRLDSLQSLLVAIAFGALCLTYNIAVEASRRNVPWKEVSIIESANRRLMVKSSWAFSEHSPLHWKNFSRIQSDRFVEMAVPALSFADISLDRSWVLSVIAFVTVLFVRRQSKDKRTLWILTVFSGILWVTSVRGLTIFHDYTAMFFLGAVLTFYTALNTLIPPKMQWIGASLACGLFLYSARSYAFTDTRIPQANQITADFEHIAGHLKPGMRVYLEGTERNLSMPEVVPGVPYAAGFYLTEQTLTTQIQAQCVVSRRLEMRLVSATPENLHYFLLCGLR